MCTQVAFSSQIQFIREEDKYISNFNQGYRDDHASSIGVWFEDPPWEAFVNGGVISAHSGI